MKSKRNELRLLYRHEVAGQEVARPFFAMLQKCVSGLEIQNCVLTALLNHQATLFPMTGFDVVQLGEKLLGAGLVDENGKSQIHRVAGVEGLLQKLGQWYTVTPSSADGRVIPVEVLLHFIVLARAAILMASAENARTGHAACLHWEDGRFFRDGMEVSLNALINDLYSSPNNCLIFCMDDEFIEVT